MNHRVLTTMFASFLPSCMIEDPFGLHEAVYRSALPAPIDDGNDLAAYVAQCEAVLGPIPEISCDPAHPDPGTHVTRIPVLVDGRLVGFGPGVAEDELAQRAASGSYTCDFPSIGGDFPCTVGSTLVQAQGAGPNVQWVGLCRGVRSDVPTYDRFIGNGLIGANEKTGEMCFFFGGNPDPSAPYELPPLRSSGPFGEVEDLSPWLPPRDMPGSCLSCHPNNDPWVMTPWLQPAYMAAVLDDPAYGLDLPAGISREEIMAARFVRMTPTKAKALLPDPLPRARTAWTEEEIFDDDGEIVHRQYRAVGSSYVAAETEGTVAPRTGVRPTSWAIPFRERLRLAAVSCAVGCHVLSNEHPDPMAADAIGRKYATSYLSETMAAELLDPHGDAYQPPGFSWMPPVPLASATGPRIDEPFRGEATVPAITPCPIPSRILAESIDVEVDCAESSATLEFEYAVLFGDVQGRDDVRFDIAAGGDAHAVRARGIHPSGVEGVAMVDSDEWLVLRNVAPVIDHARFYRITLPLAGKSEIVVDVQPKRVCYEAPSDPFAYARPTRLVIDKREHCG